MPVLNHDELDVASQVYAFLGNTLLTPMSRTESVGLDPAFWAGLSGLFDGALAEQAEELAAHAERMQEMDRASAIQRISVEHTHLFVGPPRPAAAPWESMNGEREVNVGFGAATFSMRKLLREAGLKLDNENNQYEDHMGIELLYLSELCRRCASGVAPQGAEIPDQEHIAAFIEEHPLSWIDRLHSRVISDRPDGYYNLILAYAKALLAWHAAERGML